MMKSKNHGTLIWTAIQTVLVIGLRLIFMFTNRQRSRMDWEEIQKHIEQFEGNELAGDHHPNFRYTL